MNERTYAPWMPAQLARLNAWQHSGTFHPFTCQCLESANHPRLVALKDGWHCPMEHCNYTQNWAHVMMAHSDVPETNWMAER